MVSASRWLLIPALVAGCLGLTVPASAANVAPIIKDDGKFFSGDAVTKANKKIKEIAQTYDKDLLIETFPEIPESRKKDYNPEDKSKFFEKWARDQAHENAVNGVYVLICKKPSHLQVEVGNETQKKAFTRNDRDKLAKLLIANFKEKKFDEGLLEAVDFYGTTLKEHLGKSAGRVLRLTRNGGAEVGPQPPLRLQAARTIRRRTPSWDGCASAWWCCSVCGCCSDSSERSPGPDAAAMAGAEADTAGVGAAEVL